MLDMAWVRENAEAVRDGAAKKGIAFDVDELLGTAETARSTGGENECGGWHVGQRRGGLSPRGPSGREPTPV